jgi:hypothetical protein
MSGFGIRAFKKQKLENSKQLTKKYYKHVVLGENIWASLAYLKLAKLHGKENVKFISPNHYDKQTILTELKCNLPKLRDENNATILRDKNIHLEIFPKENASIFYKDSKFHDFDGRAKPMTLLEDEDHFIPKAFSMKLEGLFSDEEWNNLDETLNAAQDNKFVSKITVTQPTDLVEKTNFVLTTGELEEIHCEKLYYCHSPKSLFKLISNKSELNDDLAEYCNALQERVGLTIDFDVDKEIHNCAQTVFLPQSQTHEWGHFILDFNEFNPSTKTQNFKAMMFINIDEINEEELAKKVRLLKRTIERIFPEFQKARVTEHIHFDQEFLIRSSDDYSSSYTQDHNSNLIFQGLGAPTTLDNGEWNSLLYESRAICALNELN